VRIWRRKRKYILPLFKYSTTGPSKSGIFICLEAVGGGGRSHAVGENNPEPIKLFRKE
jgi:hypothetical protein